MLIAILVLALAGVPEVPPPPAPVEDASDDERRRDLRQRKPRGGEVPWPGWPHLPLFNLSFLIGAPVHRDTRLGAEASTLTLGFRPEVFGWHTHVGFGGYGLVESTLGRDTVLGLGAAMVLTGGHYFDDFPWPIESSGISLFPGLYFRNTGGGWQPGVSVALSARWGDRFGIGVDGRVGLGPNAERAVIVRFELDLLLPLIKVIVFEVTPPDPRTRSSAPGLSKR